MCIDAEQNNHQQKRYWNYMLQIRAQVFYLNFYLENDMKTNRCVNYLTAIAASSSIAGWVIWSNISFIWAIFIALSQVINAIKGILPFYKRISKITRMHHYLDDVALRAESGWHDVREGNLTDSDINNAIHSLKSEISKLDSAFLSEISLPKRNDLIKLARQETVTYTDTI